MKPSETVFVGLGSNLGDSMRILQEGWRLLGEQDGVSLERISSPFLSAPVHMESNFWFTNAAGLLHISRSSLEFLDILLDTEKKLGRIRNKEKQGYQDRTLDLDLLYFGSEIIDIPRLTVPHPFRRERLFVLAPMAEIAPGWVDPETGTTIESLHRRLLERIETGDAEPQEITRSQWSQD